jgi:hypothetical protein
VLLLSAHGYDVWGLDSSNSAIELARENQRASEEDPKYAPFDERERGRIEWAAGDFFSDDWAQGAGTEGSGKFDLIFDYTVRSPRCSIFPPARFLTLCSSSARCLPTHDHNGPNEWLSFFRPKVDSYVWNIPPGRRCPKAAHPGAFGQRRMRRCSQAREILSLTTTTGPLWTRPAPSHETLPCIASA